MGFLRVLGYLMIFNGLHLGGHIVRYLDNADVSKGDNEVSD